MKIISLCFALFMAPLANATTEEVCRSLKIDEQRSCFIDLYEDSTIKTEHAKEFRKLNKDLIEHARLAKLESQCEMKEGNTTGNIFHEERCFTKKEIDKNLERAQNLQNELDAQCTNTKDKLNRTETRFGINKNLLKKIKNDCKRELKANSEQRKNEPVEDSYNLENVNSSLKK